MWRRVGKVTRCGLAAIVKKRIDQESVVLASKHKLLKVQPSPRRAGLPGAASVVKVNANAQGLSANPLSLVCMPKYMDGEMSARCPRSVLDEDRELEIVIVDDEPSDDRSGYGYLAKSAEFVSATTGDFLMASHSGSDR